jgi:hypothetical protein
MTRSKQKHLNIDVIESWNFIKGEYYADERLHYEQMCLDFKNAEHLNRHLYNHFVIVDSYFKTLKK